MGTATAKTAREPVEDRRSRSPIALEENQYVFLSSAAVYRENAASCAGAHLQNVLEDGDLIFPESLALRRDVEPYLADITRHEAKAFRVDTTCRRR
jgi:hypothetical protein